VQNEIATKKRRRKATTDHRRFPKIVWLQPGILNGVVASHFRQQLFLLSPSAKPQ